MAISDVKKEITKLDKKKLIELVLDLYKKNKSVKELLDFYAKPDEKGALEVYKEKVQEAFYPKRGYQLKLKDGKQAISDFKKLGASVELLADLMLYYVETGVQFTNDFGDINESFYSSLESTFYQTLTLMYKNKLIDHFAARTKKLMNETEDIGWGFTDSMWDIYLQFYNYDEDETIEDTTEEVTEETNGKPEEEIVIRTGQLKIV